MFRVTSRLFFGVGSHVLVQRQMESGRAPFSEYCANFEAQFTLSPKRLRPGGRGQPPKPQLVFKKKEVSFAGIIHSRERPAAENQLATKSILNIRTAKLLNKPALPAASR